MTDEKAIVTPAKYVVVVGNPVAAGCDGFEHLQLVSPLMTRYSDSVGVEVA
jgi:hypothetical protein